MSEVKVRVLTKSKTPKEEPNLSDTEIKETKKQSKEKSAKKTLRQLAFLAIKIVFLLVLFYIVFFVIFGASRMRDASMYPSVRDGDLLVYYRMENQLSNGDVIVVDRGDGEEVYRIIASPGQIVDIDKKDGGLSVDGQPSAYEAFYETKRANVAFKYPYRVNNDCYFVLNDYRSNTNDSRTFGEVCKDKIKGRLITRIQVRDL